MLYIIQSDPEVPPGLTAIELDRLSTTYTLVRLDKGEPLPEHPAATALIVLGGRMSANDEQRYPFLKELKKYIGAGVGRGIPYLGICLGGQLLAAACGASVVEQRWQERGKSEIILTADGLKDPLFRRFPQRFTSFQWHDDSFDLPEGAVLLASSAACPHQAFRCGVNAWGLQFHPEVTREIIASWLEPEPGSTHTGLLSDWLHGETEYRRVMSELMANFIEVHRGKT